MTSPIIQVENLSKLYHIGARGTMSIRDSVEDFFRKMGWQKDPEWSHRQKNRMHSSEFSPEQRGIKPDTFWALKNINLTINEGEVIGIVGRNGAGKSTLLKILSRITEPTSGRAIMRGHVASLLEVGTGFHPDLTGRENVYLNGAILGMRKREIDQKFDEIVAFAEIEKFIDTPVKHYSSGMYVRLAFAVAAHLDPEILLIDEVLAVGDAAFQKKCIGKMGDVARIGRTVIFVSHNMAAVKILCQRGLLLEEGRVTQCGDVESVINAYLNSGQTKVQHGKIPASFQRSGTGEIRIHSVELQNKSGKAIDQLYFGQSFRVVMTVGVKNELSNIVAGVHISSADGVCAASCYNTDHAKTFYEFKKGWYQISIDIEIALVPRHYVLDLGLFRSDGRDVDYVERVLYFEALNIAENSKDSYPWTTKHGFIRPEAKWQKPEFIPQKEDAVQ